MAKNCAKFKKFSPPKIYLQSRKLVRRFGAGPESAENLYHGLLEYLSLNFFEGGTMSDTFESTDFIEFWDKSVSLLTRARAEVNKEFTDTLSKEDLTRRAIAEYTTNINTENEPATLAPAGIADIADIQRIEDYEDSISSSVLTMERADKKENKVIRTFNEIILDYFNANTIHQQEDFIKYAKSVIASTLISTEVDPLTNTTPGFKDPLQTFEFLVQGLSEELYLTVRSTIQSYTQAYTDESLNIEFFNISPEEVTAAMVMEREIFDKNKNLIATIYSHPTLKSAFSYLKSAGALFLVQESETPFSQELADDLGIPVESLGLEENDNVITTMESSKVKASKFQNILVNELPTILREMFPGIYANYIGGGSATNRTGYSPDGSVSAEDQASQKLKLFQETVPRVVNQTRRQAKVTWIQETDLPFLTAEDWNSVSSTIDGKWVGISNFNGSKKDLKFLLEANKEHSKHPHFSILNSIYLRFYSDQDYQVQITDPVNGERIVTMRSLESIAALDSDANISLEEYLEVKPTTPAEAASLLNNIKGNFNAKLVDVINAITSNIASNVGFERLLSRDFKMMLSNSRAGDVKVKYRETMTRSMTKPYSFVKEGAPVSDRVLQPSTKGFLKGFKRTGNTYTKKVDADNSFLNYKFKVNSTNIQETNHKYQRGIPVTVTRIDSGPLPLTVIATQFGRLGIPHLLLSQKKLSQLRENILLFADDISIFQGEDGNMYPLESFFLSIVHLLKDGEKFSKLDANFMDQMYGFEDAVAATMEDNWGSTAKKFTTSLDNNKLAVQSPASKIRKLEQVIRFARLTGNIHNSSNSYILGGNVLLTAIGSKMEIKVGDTIKNVSTLTENENIRFLVEEAFVQRLADTDNKSAFYQAGNMADRGDVPMFNFADRQIGINNSEIYHTLPLDGNGQFIQDWSKDNILKRQWLTSHRRFHAKNEAAILDAWAPLLKQFYTKASGYIKTVTQLKRFLDTVEDFPQYDYLRAHTDLVENVMIVEGKDGRPTLSQGVVNSIELFRSTKEAKFVNAWKTKVLQVAFPKIDISHIRTIEDIRDLLNDIKETNSSSMGGVTMTMELLMHLDPGMKTFGKLAALAKSDAFLPYGLIITPAGEIQISKSKVDPIITLQDNKEARLYMDSNLEMFEEYLEEQDFTHKTMRDITFARFSNSTHKEITEKTMGNTTDMAIRKKRKVFKDIIRTYYFNQTTLGQEALQLLTGGLLQYQAPKGYISYFPINDVRINGILSESKVLSLARKATEGKTSQELSTKYGIDDRRVFIAIILETLSNDTDKVKTLITEDMVAYYGNPFIDQSKRAAVLGTTTQRPTLVAENEPGMQLGMNTKVLVINDPVEFHKLVGVSGDTPMEIYDGAAITTESFRIKVNNSLGNSESNFASKGAPSKDISISTTKNGYQIIEKKASFPLFQRGMSNRLTPEAHALHSRLFSTIKYTENGEGVTIYVDNTDDTGKLIHNSESGFAKFNKSVDINMWLEQGLSLGILLDTSLDETGTPINRLVNSSTLLGRIRRGKLSAGKFKEDLENGIYKTDKIGLSFNSALELWEYFGSVDNEDSFTAFGNIIGFYSGLKVITSSPIEQQLKLEHATYPLRNTVIERIVFKSVVKSGARQVSQKEVFTKPHVLGNELETTIPSSIGDLLIKLPKYSTLDNLHYGNILQPDHEPDVTSSEYRTHIINQLSTNTEEFKKATTALITQIIAANSAQGRSKKETKNISDALGVLSNVGVQTIKNKILETASKNALEDNKSFAFIQQLNTFFSKYSEEYRTEEEKRVFQAEFPEEYSYMEAAYVSWGRKLVLLGLSQRKDPGVILELIKRDDITLALRQIFPFAQSKIFSEFNTKGVKYRFPGGGYIVSPSNDFFRNYTVGDISGITREELNEIAYGQQFNEEEKLKFGLARTAITKGLLPFISPTDRVVSKIDSEFGVVTGKSIAVSILKSRAKKIHTVRGIQEPFDVWFENVLLNGFDTRLHKFGTVDGGAGGNTLAGQRYYNTNGIEIKETDEYISFQQVQVINDTPSKTTGTEFFSKDGYKKSDREVGIKYIPKGLARLYYFSHTGTGNTNLSATQPPSARMGRPASLEELDILQYQWSDVQNSEFEAWYELETKNNWNQLANVVFAHTKAEMLKDPAYKNILEAKLEHLLHDESQEWSTVNAEFYMPAMHANAFLINTENKSGKPADTVHTFTGLQPQPDINTLKTSGILRIFKDTYFKNSEMDLYDLGYVIDHKFREYKSKLNELLPKLPAKEKKILSTYLNRKALQRRHMLRVFKDRVTDMVLSKGLFSFQYKKVGGQEEELSLPDLIIEARKRRDAQPVTTQLWKAYNSMIIELEKRKQAFYKVDESISYNDIFNLESIVGINKTPASIIDKFITKKAEILTDNFERSLEFIAARIPGQGKQSYVAAKVKDFIHETRNSAYGPIELLIVTGQDMDIDKSSVMNYGVNKDSQIVDWADYNLTPNIAKIPTQSSLLVQVAAIKSYIDGVYQKARTTAESGGTLKDFEGKLGYIKIKAVNYEYSKFTTAIQNSIVYNLIKTIKDPKNAIEASTPANTDKISTLKKKVNYATFKGINNITPAKLLRAANVLSPDDPGSMARTEAITGAGKVNIGLTASGMKGYFVAYNVYMNITDPAEIRYLGVKSAIDSFDNDVSTFSRVAKYIKAVTATEDTPGIDIHQDAIQFIKLDKTGMPVVQELRTIANAEIHIGTKKEPPAEVRRVQQKLRSNLDTDAQIAVIMAFTNGLSNLTDLHFFNNYLTAITVEELTSQIDVQLLTNSNVLTDISREVYNMKAKIALLPAADQAKLVVEYLNNLNIYDKLLTEPQAWQDLSEILTAATDNAKLMILGAVGITSNTNAVIVSMIRMGVSLEDAVSLMQELFEGNDVLSREVVERITTSIDVHKKTPFSKDSLQGAIAVTLISNVPDGGLYPAKILVESPVFRILPFVHIASEFSSIAKFAASNQGMKIPADQDYFYIKGFEASINRVLKRATKAGDTPIKFITEKFIKDIEMEKRDPSLKSSYVADIINTYEKAKIALNVPFILKKSPQFFNYLLAQFDAGTAVNIIANVSNVVHSLLDTAIETEELNISDLEKNPRIYSTAEDFYYASGITMFLQDESISKFTLHGIDFDLSTNEGRLDFLTILPTLVSATLSADTELSNNPFLLQLRPVDSRIDYATQLQIEILKVENQQFLPAHITQALKIGAAQVKSLDENLYNALYLYSLIVNGGKYAGGSFSSLFGPLESVPYSNFLEANLSQIEAAIKSEENYKTFLLYNQGLIQEEKTSAESALAMAQEDQRREDGLARRLAARNAGEINPDIDGNMEYVEVEDVGDEDYQDDIVEMEDTFSDVDEFNEDSYYASITNEGYQAFLARDRSRFYISYFNERRRNNTTQQNMFKSFDNGLTYEWNPDLELYVFVVQTFPKESIPFNIGENITSKKSRLGFTHGLELNTDEGTLTIYSYIEEEYKLLLTRKNDLTEDTLPLNEWASLPAIKFKEDVNYYVVRLPESSFKPKTTHGYSVMSEEELHALIKEDASDIYIDGPKVGKIHRIGQRIETINETFQVHLGKKDGHLYSSPRKGTSEVTLQVAAIDRATTAHTSSYYDKNFFNVEARELRGTSTNIEKDYTIDKVLLEYEKLRDRLIMLKFKKGSKFLRKMNDQELKNIIKADGGVFSGKLISVTTEISDILPHTQSDMVKLVKLYNAEDVYKQILRKKLPELSEEDISFPDIKKIPMAAIQIMLGGEQTVKAASGTSIESFEGITGSNLLQLEYFFNTILKSPTLFTKYIYKAFFPNTRYKSLTTPTGTIFVEEGIIESMELESPKTKYTQKRINPPKTDKPPKFQVIYASSMDRKLASAEISVTVMNRFAKFLSGKFDGMEFLVLEPEQIEQEWNIADASSIRGMIDGNVIVFNRRTFSLSTPIHEFTHVYFEHLKKFNRVEFDKLAKLALKSPLYGEMKAAYPLKSEIDLAEEIMVETVARDAAGDLILDGVSSEILNNLSTPSTKLGKLIAIIQQYIYEFFGVDAKYELTHNDSFETAMKKLGDRMIYGKTSMLSDFTSAQKKLIKMSNHGNTLNLKEARKLLVSTGFIQRKCI